MGKAWWNKRIKPARSYKAISNHEANYGRKSLLVCILQE